MCYHRVKEEVKMNSVTSDPVAQKQLEAALRAAQEKIITEGKKARHQMEERRRQAIAARVRLLWGTK